MEEEDDRNLVPSSGSSEDDSSDGADLSPGGTSPWNNGVTRIGDGGLQQQIRYGYRCISSMLKRDGQVLCVTLAGGLLYTGAESKRIRVRTHPDLVEYGSFKSGSGRVKALAAAENPALVFSAHRDQRIRVWRRSRSNPTLHRRLATLPTFKDCVSHAMSPTPPKHAGVVTCLAYDAGEGLLYSGSADKRLKVWRISDLRCVETIQAHNEAVNAVAVGAGGLVFTGSADGTVKVWRRAGAGIPNDDGYKGHLFVTTLGDARCTAAVTALAVSPEGLVVYAGRWDGNISYWEKARVLEGEMRQPGEILAGHRRAVRSVATVHSLVLSGSADTTIRVWRRASAGSGLHVCLAVLVGHCGGVESVAGSVDCENGCLIYSGGLDGMLKVWWASI